MKLTLLRHGMTEGNLRHLYYGSTDLPLLPEGKEALKELAIHGGYPIAQRYYTSGYLRTEQTLHILYGDIAHEILPDLREMDFGEFEMRGYTGDLENDAAFRDWCSNVEENICPNGESSQQMIERAKKAIAPILAQSEDAVCVIHGGVIARLMMAWFPDNDGNPYIFTPAPGCGFQVTVENCVPVSYQSVPQ